MPKKVLIVYATGGMGHIKAAEAVEKAFQEKYKNVEVTNIDIIDFATAAYRKVFVDGYNLISAKTPGFWAWLYRMFKFEKSQQLANLVSRRELFDPFVDFIAEKKPDFIVTTHPLPTYLLAVAARKEVIDILSSIVVTDFGCHSFWVNPEINYYFTATKQVGYCLSQYGVKNNEVVVTGIPIDPKFSRILDKNEMLKKCGLEIDVQTILIVGGQFTYSKLLKIINGIKEKVSKVQFIVVSGRDKDLQEALDKSNLGFDKSIKVYGFVDNMHELMSAADLIFSKAGGLTVSECMAKGLPMVIHKVIPGQETDNVNYVVSQGAGVQVDNLENIAQSVAQILNSKQGLAEMKKAAIRIGRPNSATDLVDFVYETIKSNPSF